MAEQLHVCPHCGGNIETELNCSICRVLFGHSKTFRSEDWLRRTPSPATAAMLEAVKTELCGFPESDLIPVPPKVLAAFLAEWPDPATPPTPEQPAPSSPWKCSVCGEPVRIAGDLTVWHYDGPTNHDAELSIEDRKFLADGLRLTD